MTRRLLLAGVSLTALAHADMAARFMKDWREGRIRLPIWVRSA